MRAAVNATNLPDADFYLFYDSRSDDPYRGEHLACQSPGHPDFLITEQILHMRKRVLENLYPEVLDDPHSIMKRDEIPSFFEQLQIDIPPELMPPTSWFDSRLPAYLGHIELARWPSDNHPVKHLDWLYIVSNEWKYVIESVEPGVHEFFPHRIVFCDAEISDRYIFRNKVAKNNCLLPPDAAFIGNFRYNIDNYRVEDRMNLPADAEWAIVGYQRADVRVDAAKLTGHHWVSSSRSYPRYNIVSRMLADKLVRLLPRFTFLVPLANAA